MVVLQHQCYYIEDEEVNGTCAGFIYQYPVEIYAPLKHGYFCGMCVCVRVVCVCVRACVRACMRVVCVFVCVRVCGDIAVIPCVQVPYRRYQTTQTLQ